MDAAQLYRMLVFATVVEQGSLTAAADVLGVSRSMISQHVKHLEQRLSLTLLHRTTRKISLSDDGQHFYHYCAELLQLAKQAEAVAIPQDHQLQGSLKISVPVCFGEHRLIPLLGLFHQSYPNIRLTVQLDDRHPHLQEQHLDIAINTSTHKERDNEAIVLSPFEEYLVASQHYISHHGTPLHPDNLTHHQWIMLGGSYVPKACHFTNTDNEHFALNITPFINCNTHNGIIALATQGLGIAVLADYLIEEKLASGELIRLLPEYRLTRGELVLNHPYQDSIPPRVKVFLTFIRQHLFS